MLMLSAFFSGSEIAFNSANKLRLKRAAEAGSKTADLAYRFIDKFTVALSAILIGNNLANIAASSATTLILLDVLDALGITGGRGEAIGSATATVIIPCAPAARASRMRFGVILFSLLKRLTTIATPMAITAA